tara:strand:+ start:5213 stop:6202 length:990 start_codon:yes stop_codon:yes gene_type:complete
MIDYETLESLDMFYQHTTPDDGEIAVVAANKKHPVGFYRVDELDKAAKAMFGQDDLYIKVNLMDSKAIQSRGPYAVGNRQEVKTIVSFHLDFDAGKDDRYLSRDEALAAMNRMPHPPSIIVNSDGEEGGFHPYWLLDEPYRIKSDDDREFISSLTYRWQTRLNELAAGKLDSTANIDRVLRVVGGNRSNGNRVQIHEYYPHRRYSVEQLTIPATDAEIVADATNSVKALFRSAIGFNNVASADCERHKAALNAMAKVEPAIGEKDGSRRLMAYCRQAKRWGVEVDEAVQLVRQVLDSCPTPREWTNEEITDRYLQSTAEFGEALEAGTW